MKALDILVEEHRLIERLLNTLEIGIDLLEKGTAVRPEFFLSATDFMRGYADGCHHAKEEGVLFRYMEHQGIPDDGCPLGVMLAEHACGRQYMRALVSAARALQAGEPSAKRRAIMSSRSYITLLRQHIYKEDNILFPMAEGVIPTSQHAALYEDFEQEQQAEIAEGAHEKYLQLAEALGNEIKIYL